MKKIILAIILISLIILAPISINTVAAIHLKNHIEKSDLQENVPLTKDFKGKIMRSLFMLAGVGLLLAWFVLFIKGNPGLLSIGILSFLTTKWQRHGHMNDYLPNNVMKPFKPDRLFIFILFELSVLMASAYVFGSRAMVVFALAWHLLLETGYWMGFVDTKEDGKTINFFSSLEIFFSRVQQFAGC